jgi:2-amino-4-hydroxy-6-hydroxymethyldihydropteridine diphosphokinase
LERVIIMLGSNIEPGRNLPDAVHALGSIGEVIAVSSVWQTAAVGDPSQADFCNAAAVVETEVPLRDLPAHLRSIEDRMGR